ncbi:MAG: hypothetical protein NXI01_01375 [Gammaproteobacteria bacterium]|nr:hypothetical protein [Gammaproteobacteria bacterium]
MAAQLKGMKNMKIIPTNAPPMTAEYIGSVEDVLAGRADPELIAQRFMAANCQYGFELASPKDAASLGEAVIVNNTCFATSTDSQSADYMQTISGDTFLSTGCFMIPTGAKPNFKIKDACNTPVAMNDYYQRLYDTVKTPFAFAGFFTFSSLQMMVLGKAPIYEEPIFENQATYFPQRPATQTEVTAFLVGAVANYHDEAENDFLEKLKVVLYQNPFDTRQILTTHAHAVTLHTTIENVEAITPDVVDKTIHVLADQTQFTALDVDVFSMDNIKAVLF